MHSDEDSFFYELQPSTSGITLSHMNNKSSVLCPETQNITSQYLALQQLDAHQKMVSRAKGVVDTSAPKSMQSYKSVSSQHKRRMLKQLKNNSHPNNLSDVFNRPSSSRLEAYYSEEDGNESMDVPLHNKAIQTGIPVSNFTCKTAEKISWYLEALSLGELQSDYFAFLNHNCNHTKQLQTQQCFSKQCKKKTIKGDIMEWHKEHFMKPKSPFSPRILDNPSAKSKVRGMRCYNPPFRKTKLKKSHSSDTFESYDEDEESNQMNEQPKSSSDISSVEEETLINKRSTEDVTSHHSRHSSIPLVSPHKRDYNSFSDPTFLNRSEEDKYLNFLSKVTEDILRSGVYSDKAIRQAFEFHIQFYENDPNKEKLHSLLEQVLEGLKVTNDDVEENFQPRKSFLFSLSRPNSPPEKETSSALLANDSNYTDINATPDGSVIDKESDNS